MKSSAMPWISTFLRFALLLLKVAYRGLKGRKSAIVWLKWLIRHLPTLFFSTCQCFPVCVGSVQIFVSAIFCSVMGILLSGCLLGRGRTIFFCFGLVFGVFLSTCRFSDALRCFLSCPISDWHFLRSLPSSPLRLRPRPSSGIFRSSHISRRVVGRLGQTSDTSSAGSRLVTAPIVLRWHRGGSLR